MNLKTTLLSLLIFASQVVYSQNFSKEYGKVGRDDIELTQYQKELDAEAVVMFDYGKSYFVRTEDSYDVAFERTTRIKILNEAGIKWAEVEILFYHEGGIYEQVFDVEASSYNFENGLLNKTTFDVSNAFDEKLNNYWTVKKFAIPNVKAGSIIEYKYKINSQYKFNLRDWEFQWKIPVIYSEYEVKMIPFYEYSWLLQGTDRLDIQDSYVDKGLSQQFGLINFQEMVHKFVKKDIPAFNGEEFITTVNDYIMKIDFQLSKITYPDGRTVPIITTWKELINDLTKHEDFGKYIRKTEKLAPKTIEASVSQLNTEKEKFNFIIDYMKKNFSWNNSYGKYASKSPNKLLDEKQGNSADLNLFALGLLNSAGIKAYPVIISTRDNGKIYDKYPYINFFNYVLIQAKVDGVDILSDVTDPNCLNNRIPTQCINNKGLLINNESVQWIALESFRPSEIRTNIEIEKISDELQISTVSVATNEYEALYYRDTYADDIQKIKANFNSEFYSLIDTSVVVQNQYEIEKPYQISYKLSSGPETLNNKLLFSPFINEVISDNPLKQKERTYPIDMIFPRKRSFTSAIKIPDGFQVEFLPADSKINNQQFELNYSIVKSEQIIKVTFDYIFKSPVYQPVEYSKIKYYFNEIVKKGNEKIVLIRSL
ncbi:MAG: DUF3857 domain-containing protein [Draconibacterium sp.]